MHKLSLLTIFSLLLIGTFSCKSAEEQRAAELKKEVLEMHDVLMKKTEDLVKMRTQLAKAQNQSKSMVQRTAIKSTIILINAAESFMEDWMQYYAQNEPKADAEIDAVVDFYEKQLKELNRMNIQMDDALEKGKEWLKKMNS
ncbi:hypothetical protein GC194_07960 [bacterium]|nr:hypothetical protein [bacterium]